jgi:hypothetical protein
MGKWGHGWDRTSTCDGLGPTGGMLTGKLARAPIGPSRLAGLYVCPIRLQVY